MLYVLLCRTLLRFDQIEAALEVIERGLQTAERNSERIFEAELYRLKAQAVAARDEADARVPSLLNRAGTIAKSQGARWLELRIAIDLAERWCDEGRCRRRSISSSRPMHHSAKVSITRTSGA